MSDKPCTGCFNLDHDLPADRTSVYTPGARICAKCEAEEQALPNYPQVKRIYDLCVSEGVGQQVFPKGAGASYFLDQYRHAFPPEFGIDLPEVEGVITNLVHETFGSYWRVKVRPYWQNAFHSKEAWENHKAYDIRNRHKPEYVIEASVRGVLMVLDEHGGWWVGGEGVDYGHIDADIFGEGQITDASPEALRNLIEKEWVAALAHPSKSASIKGGE